MNFQELERLKLPPEVWSLIQRGLNHLGYYHGTYMGKPGPKTRAAYEMYIGGEDVDGGSDKEPRWMRIARNEIGVKEFPGPADNPEVVKYLKSVDTLSPRLQVQDETHWCSAFVNWCMEQSGIKGTENAMARSWLNWGRDLEDPTPGCVVVLWRGSPRGRSGHVGFFVEETGNSVSLLGGNQSDEVNISRYPKSKVLGYRTTR